MSWAEFFQYATFIAAIVALFTVLIRCGKYDDQEPRPW